MIVPVLNRFLHWSIVGIFSPVITLVMLSKDVPVEMVGVAIAILSATVIVFELPSGILSDFIGRKRVYLVSLCIQAAAYLIVFFSRGFAPLALGFAVYGISRAFSSGSIESVYISEFIGKHGKENLHKLMTAMGVGETAGLALGALAGGVMPILWGRFVPDGNKYNGNLALQVAIVFVLAVLTLFHRVRDESGREPNLKAFLKDGFSFVKTSETVRFLLLGMAFWGLCFNAIELYWQPQLKELLGSDRDTWVFGLLNSGYFMASLAGSIVIGCFLSRKKIPSLAVIGVFRIVMGLSVVGLSCQTGFPGFAFFYLFTFLFNGMSNVPEGTAFNSAIPDDKRSSMLSLSSLVVQVGGISGSLIYSVLVVHASIGVIWLIAGIILAASSAIYLYMNARHRL